VNIRKAYSQSFSCRITWSSGHAWPRAPMTKPLIYAISVNFVVKVFSPLLQSGSSNPLTCLCSKFVLNRTTSVRTSKMQPPGLVGSEILPPHVVYGIWRLIKASKHSSKLSTSWLPSLSQHWSFSIWGLKAIWVRVSWSIAQMKSSSASVVCKVWLIGRHTPFENLVVSFGHAFERSLFFTWWKSDSPSPRLSE